MSRADALFRRCVLRTAKAGQRGFAVVSAIFLVVVLAMLGTAMLNFATTQHISSLLDVQGARAYQAARAGIEWGLYQQLRQGGTCSGSASFALPAGTSLSSFTVSVSYSGTTYSNAGAVNGIQLAPGVSISICRITATACNGPSSGNCPGTPNGPGYVERQIQATFQQ